MFLCGYVGGGLELRGVNEFTNIILVGAFDKSCDIRLSHYNSKSFHDQVLVKYDSAGTVLFDYKKVKY